MLSETIDAKRITCNALAEAPKKVHMNARETKRLPASFFRRENGSEPVRDWLPGLSAEDRKTIGVAVKTVGCGWPLGMPACRPVSGRKGLWEVRADISDGRIARVFFCERDGAMVLLHGIVEKTQKAPAKQLDLAMNCLKGVK